MKKLISITCIFFELAFLQAGISIEQTNYYSPTEMLITRESWEIIEPILVSKRKIPSELFPLFDSIASEEDWGHIGYHGANHDFRFYQDVIKFSFEEILNIPIRDDFQFLRWPGDKDLNLNSVTEFIQYWEKKDAVDNRDTVRAKQLLSMNYGIYSNFDTSGSCSISLFVHNKSSIKVDYVQELIPFYEMIGVINSKESLEKLYEIFNTRLTKKGGILLQISEDSHLTHPQKVAYSYLDEQCYPAFRGGRLYDDQLVSDHYKTAMTEDYINKEKNISDQLRLVLNNQHTLNPYSHLKIKRWDQEKPREVTKYEKAMRAAIRDLQYSKKKWRKYNKYLLTTWKQIEK